MTGHEIMGWLKACDAIDNLTGEKIIYAILKNKKKMETKLKELNKLMEWSEEMNNYNKERIELNEKWCAKSPKGMPLTDDNGYIIPKDNQESYNKEQDELREKYKEAIKRYEDNAKKFQEAMKLDYEMEYHMIAKKDIPSDITLAQLELIDPFIKY